MRGQTLHPQWRVRGRRGDASGEGECAEDGTRGEEEEEEEHETNEGLVGLRAILLYVESPSQLVATLLALVVVTDPRAIERFRESPRHDREVRDGTIGRSRNAPVHRENQGGRPHPELRVHAMRRRSARRARRALGGLFGLSPDDFRS